MPAEQTTAPAAWFRPPVQAWLIRLGGGDRQDLGERHERAAYAAAGLVVAVNAVLAALVTAAAVRWPAPAAVPLALLCAVLAGAMTRALAIGAVGPARSNLLGRLGVGVALGVILGELAALAVFAGSIDGRLGQLAARDAEFSPAVTLAAANLDRARTARGTLDDAVAQARGRRDDALIVARCEYHPTPGCPQTHITGVPGTGPETRTANDLLADAQRELDDAVAVRDRRTAELDGDIGTATRMLTQARDSAFAAADRGVGARWLALNDYARSHPGVVSLRLALIAAFTLLAVLPLVIRVWRGETGQDRREAARAEIDRAELWADVVVAVRRAEARAAAEPHRAIASRVATAVPVLDIAPAAAALPVAADRLPARVTEPAEPAVPAEPAGAPAGASIPDIARTAARWVRPLVPPVVARVIDTTTRPVRGMRQAFEEIEELTFALRRTHRVNLHALTTDEAPAPQRPRTAPQSAPDRDTALTEPHGRLALPPG